MRAKAGGNLSQMHYARQGMITPESLPPRFMTDQPGLPARVERESEFEARVNYHLRNMGFSWT